MIRHALIQDLDAIMAIVSETIHIMEREDNPQWDSVYPARQDFEGDIHDGTLYIYDEDHEIKGFVCLDNNEPEEYKGLNWAQDKRALVIHRMAVAPAARKQGIGSTLIQFAETVAKNSKVYYMKTDTYSRNVGMNRLFQLKGFCCTGQMDFKGKPDKFNCYEKVLA